MTHNKDLPIAELSKILSERLGKEVSIQSAERISSGFISDGYKLILNDGTKYFLKRFRKSELTRDIPEIHLADYLLSNEMMERAGVKDRGMQVLVQNGSDVSSVPDLSLDSVLYHVQPFKDLPDKSYWNILEGRKEKKEVGEEEKREIKLVIDLISKIHSGPTDQEKSARNNIYNGGLQATLGPIFFLFLHGIVKDHPLLPHAKHGDYIGKMTSVMHDFRDRGDRLRTLHGDFWGGNVFLDPEKEKIEAIDFSRVPFGDPAFDIAYWMEQYVWFYCKTGNPYFRQLGEMFLSKYELVSGDKEIRKAMALPMGLLTVIYLCPLVFPDADPKAQEKLFKITMNSLEQKEFSWE